MTSQKFVDSSNPRNETSPKTERAIILKRPLFWSYIFASLMMGVGIGAGAWMATVRFDQKILATGNLEFQGAVKEIKAPTNGVVQDIYVKDGDEVKPDKPIATFKTTVSEAELESLQKEKEVLIGENQIYEDVLKGGNVAGESDSSALPQLRVQLVNETQYYQALVKDENLQGEDGTELNANQQRLLAASSPELQARASAARMQIQELEKRQSLVKEKLAEAEKLLALNQDVQEKLTQASREVSVPKQQHQRQKQEVLSNQEVVDKLKAEQERVIKDIAQAKDALKNTLSVSAKDVQTKITQNQKRIAQIDAQLKQAQQNNLKRIAEIDAKLNTLAQPQRQSLKSPIAGFVFDVQPSAPGYVAKANQTLLTIVPDDGVVASVFLQSQDIELVKEGMDAEVRVASFPKSEFGSIEGKVTWVSSEVLPPAPERPYYAIPARIQLKRPYLEVSGNPIRLQPGMAVNGDIILLDKLTVWDVVRDKWNQKAKAVGELVR